MSLDFSQVTDLAADLAAAAGKVTAAAALDLARVGADILNDAEASAPRLTGLLASSYSIEVDGLSAVMRNDAPYADYVEYGTSDTPAQPSLGPALERHQDQLGQDTADAAFRALR